ncbi:MAG: HD domain-containing protein [Bacteroidetes bacterium]|nr:MAG: HD domain-containing protein [Bacteroidota bacterium]
MNSTNNDLLVKVKKHMAAFFSQRIGAEYVFHDWHHTLNVVEAVHEIGQQLNLPQDDLEVLEIAAWFHDSGYDQGPEGHEERGCSYAESFLSHHNYPHHKIAKVKRLIMATKTPHSPKDLLEEVICDADLSHLGKKSYWDRCGRIRQELLMTRSIIMSEQEWVDFELDFMRKHQYFTTVAETLYAPRKMKHIKQLRKQKLRLNPQKVESVDDLAKNDKKKKKKKKKITESLKSSEIELKQLNLGRGVETMFRATYRTHVNLSSIADNKANIMLSINAIIISIVLPQLVPRFSSNPALIVPTNILLVVCLASMVFATLATRPKITKTLYTRKDIETRQANLLFFGNFYRMPYADFQWGMMEMIRDSDFLYSSMTKDIYYLGVVLAKKYRYLSICYAIFMYGMIGAVLAFAIAFLM